MTKQLSASPQRLASRLFFISFGSVEFGKIKKALYSKYLSSSNWARLWLSTDSNYLVKACRIAGEIERPVEVLVDVNMLNKGSNL